MTVDRKTRELLLLALGCPKKESDADFALCIMLESLHAEAELIGDEGTLVGDQREIAQRALARRIEALKGFVDTYMIASWHETTVEARAAE